MLASVFKINYQLITVEPPTRNHSNCQALVVACERRPVTRAYKMISSEVMLGVTLWWTSIPSKGEYKYLLVASCYTETTDDH